jgi:hypothetical protein
VSHRISIFYEPVGGDGLHVYLGWDGKPGSTEGNVRISGPQPPDGSYNDGSISVSHELFAHMCESYLEWFKSTPKAVETCRREAGCTFGFEHVGRCSNG